jgi:hypothetical protein
MKFSIATALFALAALTRALPIGVSSDLEAREMNYELELRDEHLDLDARDLEVEQYDARDLVISDLEARKGGAGGIADVLEVAITAFVNLAKGIKQDKIVRCFLVLLCSRILLSLLGPWCLYNPTCC